MSFIKLLTKNKFSQTAIRIIRLVYYPFYREAVRAFEFTSIESLDKTLNLLSTQHKSFARFGDGEINIMFKGNSVGFQNFSSDLQKDLFHVAKSKNDMLYLGIPHAFLSTKQDRLLVKSFWWSHVVRNKENITKFLNIAYTDCFLDASFSRTVTENSQKIIIDKTVNSVCGLWKNKRVLVIEGRGTRFGVGNNLFKNAESVSRIIAPEKNAYSKINVIEHAARDLIRQEKIGSDFITLIALGPTATVLASRLSGICQAIDIGHFDLQYEYLMTGKYHKVNIPSRYDNEMIDGDVVTGISDKGYLSQIVCEIN